MKHPIRPETLKILRERRRFSQDSLAARSKEMRQSVGVATIKRIETWSKTETYMARWAVAERLANVLGVDVDDLAKKPTVGDIDRTKALRKIGLRQLRAAVQEDTFLSFRMVEHLYGIPVRTQIEMAPLFMAMLAEGSLDWRKKRLAEINEKAEQLISLGGGSFSFVQATYRTVDAALVEAASIQERDVFGKHVAEDSYSLGYDPNTNNPFADYLRQFARDLDATDVMLDPEGFDIGPLGFPEYRIGAELLYKLTAGDADAEYALACGHVRISEIPNEMLDAENADRRVEWLISQVPDEEIADRKARRAELLSFFDDIDLDSLGSANRSNEAKGNGNE